MSDVAVALHPEGVDRNTTCSGAIALVEPSPSTRRAWIEISSAGQFALIVQVALHPEGVDRNISIALIWVGEVASPST